MSPGTQRPCLLLVALVSPASLPSTVPATYQHSVDLFWREDKHTILDNMLNLAGGGRGSRKGVSTMFWLQVTENLTAA